MVTELKKRPLLIIPLAKGGIKGWVYFKPKKEDVV
jgi:hypothetical protein